MSDPTAPLPSQPDDTPPDVPDFDLIRPIGQGGFGRVWLATNRTTGHLRAVKVIPLRGPGTADPAGREITSLTRLEANVRRHHPNLLNIHHVGRTAKHLFYVMDPADDLSGTAASSDAAYRPASLQRRLEAGPLPARQCVDYARELLLGLASLHAAGMVHRDVKPANCLFVDGRLKLADFGLLTEANPQISRVGTQKYMPPDGRMDARADVYAAGLVVYEMITGLPADGFPHLGERAAQVAQDANLCLLTRLALGACQPDPQQRFRDARAMLAELEVPDPGIAAARAWLRRPALVGLAYLLVAASVAGVVLWPDRPRAGYLPVEVSFITKPYEALIFLDGTQQLKADGSPWTTPCTIENLPARDCRVLFKHPQHPDLDAGRIDFAEMRQIAAHWP